MVNITLPIIFKVCNSSLEWSDATIEGICWSVGGIDVLLAILQNLATFWLYKRNQGHHQRTLQSQSLPCMEINSEHSPLISSQSEQNSNHSNIASGTPIVLPKLADDDGDLGWRKFMSLEVLAIANTIRALYHLLYFALIGPANFIMFGGPTSTIWTIVLEAFSDVLDLFSFLCIALSFLELLKQFRRWIALSGLLCAFVLFSYMVFIFSVN